MEIALIVFLQGEKNKIRSSLHQKVSVVITNAYRQGMDKLYHHIG